VLPVYWALRPDCCGCGHNRLVQVEDLPEESKLLVGQAMNATALSGGDVPSSLPLPLAGLLPHAEAPEEPSVNSSELLGVSQAAEAAEAPLPLP